jgi:hypothetical protein
MSPDWIAVIIAALTFLTGLPAFVREIRTMTIASPVSTNAMQSTAQSRRAITRMLILALLACGAAAYSVYDRHVYHGAVDPETIKASFSDFHNYTEIYHRSYKHETVPRKYLGVKAALDGLHCRDCSFEDVVLAWRGTAPYILEHPTFVPNREGEVEINFRSDNPIAWGTAALLKMTGGLRPGVQLTPRQGPM